MACFMESDMSAPIRRDRGVTLIEVLIAIVLSSLLIGLFLHADLAVNRSLLRWMHRSSLEQTTISLARQLRRDFDDCDSIHVGQNGEIAAFHSGIVATRYSFGVNAIVRNGRSLLSLPITVGDISFEHLRPGWETALLGSARISVSPLVIKLTLGRGNLATQTLILPIRPYSTRQIE